MAAKLIFECPNDGEFLIQFMTFPDGRPTIGGKGKGESWIDETVGYVGTPEERASAAHLPLRFASVEPDDGDVQHWRFIVQCPMACGYRAVMRNDESVKRVMYPIVRVLHDDGALWRDPITSATHLQKLMQRAEVVFAREPTAEQIREFIRHAVYAECP